MKNIINYKCIRCGKLFTNSHSKKANKYCSRDCYRGHKEDKPIFKHIEIECRVCKKHFLRTYKRAIYSKFCSRLCSYIGRNKRPLKWRSEVMPVCKECGKVIWYGNSLCGSCCKKGERSYTWKGGFTPEYKKIIGKKWWKELRDEVISYHGKHCWYCDKFLEIGWQMHHLYPRRISNNDSITNLVPCCKSCHGKADSAYRKQEKHLFQIKSI